MATMAGIPLAGIDFSVFAGGNRLLGIAEASLPELNFITAEIAGAGLAGKFNANIKGMLDSAELELTFRTVTDEIGFFTTSDAVDIQLYAAMENYNAATGALSAQQIKMNVRGFVTKRALGDLKQGEQTSSKATIELLYCNITIGGKRLLEFDKINYKFIDANGVDHLAEVRNVLNI